MATNKNVQTLSLIGLCLCFVSFIGTTNAQICAGLAQSGDYSYEVSTVTGKISVKLKPLAPITGSASAIVFIREGVGSGAYPGYQMTASGSDFVYTKTIGVGTPVSFYFAYAVPTGGERNSSANPHDYIMGTTCVTGAPAVSLTSPMEAASFTAPASINLTATASDVDGSVSKVEFYSGTTLIGTDNTSPYSFNWTNVAAGSYALTVKATDNSNLSTTSIPVNIIVNAPNTNGYCGTAFSRDYDYKVVTVGDVVTVTFHPLQPILGCNSAFVYIRETASGAYPGYQMTASGTDFIYTKTIANNTQVSIYFTYNTPPMGERNSSANPHSYTVGTNCTGIIGSAPTINITSPANNATFTEPSTITINAMAADADGTVTKVDFYNGATLLGSDNTSPYSFTWTNVAAGNYNISAKATDNSGYTTISSFVKVIVNINNSTGFCATLANGDYSYKAEKIGSDVVFSFHPLTPIVGCAYAFIYVRETATGAYPGYAMTAIGSDFRFIKPIADSTLTSIYFTYQVPSGGERNSSLTPHAYKVGKVCLGSVTPTATTAEAQRLTLKPTLVTTTLTIVADENSATTVRIFNSMGQQVQTVRIQGEQTLDVSQLTHGLYIIRTDKGETGRFVKE
jgi:Bacterial Ig domain/Secretion system C-terminal sorting domain